MGVTTVDEANQTGGSTTTSSSTIGGNVDSTTLSTSTMPSHTHSSAILYINIFSKIALNICQYKNRADKNPLYLFIFVN